MHISVQNVVKYFLYNCYKKTLYTAGYYLVFTTASASSTSGRKDGKKFHEMSSILISSFLLFGLHGVEWTGCPKKEVRALRNCFVVLRLWYTGWRKPYICASYVISYMCKIVSWDIISDCTICFSNYDENALHI